MPRKKYLSVLTVFLILLQYFSPLVGLIPAQATGNSNVCPDVDDGWTEHFGPNGDGEVDYTAPAGYVVDSVCIKGGSEGNSGNGYLEIFTTNDWYEVTYTEKVGEGDEKEDVEFTKDCVGAAGIGSETANAMRGDAPGKVCAGISHASFKLARVQGEELVCTPGVNLLKNPDFETPVVTTAANWDIVPNDTAGLEWKVEWQSTETLFEGQNRPKVANLELHKGVNGWLPQAGAQYAELDADWFGPSNPLNNEPASVKISQEIATIPGYEYKIEYHFSPRPGTSEADNKLVSAWNGVALDTHTGTGAGNTAWTKYTKTAEATSEKAVVSFMDDGTPNSLGTFIDDVRVECVGEVKETVEPLLLTSMCWEGDNLHRFRVRNTNEFGVDYEISRPVQWTDGGTAPTGDSYFTVAGTKGEATTTKIRWQDENDVWKETVKAANNNYCEGYDPSLMKASLHIKKYECSEGSVLNKTSFTTGEIDLNENQIRPDSTGLVNGIAFDQLDDESFAGCVEGEAYMFEVDQHPEDTAGGGSPTGTVVPLDDVITDANGDGVLSDIEYEGRLEVRELKDDPSRILGFACYRNGEGHGDISNYGEYALFNEDREAYCVAFNKPVQRFADVTVCKQDNQQNYLSGWNVQLLGELVDSVEVLPDDLFGGSITPVMSEELAIDDYVLLASGAYDYRGGTNLKSDAGYSERLESDGLTGPYAPWINVFSFDPPYQGSLGITVNGAPTDWGYYSPTHNYAKGYTDFGGKFSFTSLDDNTSDNSGSMTVDIYRGYAGLTGQNGCITFEDVPYGEYTTDEILMKDWENVSGKATQVVVDSETETFTLTNRQVMGTIEGMKYEDADANGRMDDGEEGLEDWQIVIKPETLEPLQELQVPTNNISGVNSSVLTNDRVYLLEASGVWDNANGRDDVDAEYWSRDGWSTIGDFENDPTYDPREIDLVINNQNVNWGAYNAQHLYKTVLTGEGESINFRIYDYNLDESVAWYNDNIGSLTVRIYDVTDYVVVTDDSGKYSKDLMNGEYQVVEINQPGWIQTAPRPSYCHLTVENGSTETCEFGNTRMGSIDGYKLEDTNGDGTLTRQDERLAGWEINLWTGNASEPISKIQTKTTNSDGYYKFDNLLPGIYWLTETQQEGWTQTAGPAKRGPLNIQVGTNLHGNNFGNFQLGRVQGYKWEDLNGNSAMDEDRAALLAGWTITLEDLDADDENKSVAVFSLPHDVTDEKGAYEFDGLMPGRYKVCEQLQEGWMQTYPNYQNISREMDPKCHYIVIDTSGQELVNYNFGNFELGQVSGYKWDDDNGVDLEGNVGMRDNGEPKLPGWTIELHTTEPSDAQDVAPFATTETDSNGNYMFSNLMPDTYYLVEVAKSGQQDWVQTYPTDPTYHTFTIMNSGEVLSDLNFGNNLTADLEVIKTTETTTAVAGSQVTYNITVENVGTEDIGTEGVNVWDDIPDGVVYTSSTPNGTYNGTLRRVSWVIPTLAVDEVWEATVTVTIPVDFNVNVTQITNIAEAMRSCEVQGLFSTTVTPTLVEEIEPVTEYCEIDPTPLNNTDSVNVTIGSVAGVDTKNEETTGSIRGIATSTAGKVLGASNSLSDTGRNMLSAITLGMLLLSGVVFVNFKKTKKQIA